MKIAVIGAGNWGINLVRNLRDLNVLSHVVETSPELRERARTEAPSAEMVEDYTSLLDSDIDAVAIATPVPTHFQIAESFLKEGKDVFVEKPITFSSEEARNLTDLASVEKRVLMVGHLLLYQPAIRFIKSYLDEEKLGKIYHLHQTRMKLGRARSVENVAWSFGVHDIAVLLHLVGGAPVTVVASGHCGLQSNIEDDIYIHLEFDGGVKAHLHSSWLWPENKRGLTVVGERGMLVYDETGGTVTLHRKTINTELQNCDEGSEVVFETGDAQPLRTELQHFMECIETRATPISDGRNGLEVILVLERVAAK